MSGRSCHCCGPTDRELRPYGPGGAMICFPCMKATPEREAAAEGAFGAQLEAVGALGLGLIGTEAGPINVDAEDIAKLISPPPVSVSTKEAEADG